MCSSQEKLAATLIPGNTIEEIENELEHLGFEQMRKLLVMLNCSIGEVAGKILRAKGLKCSTKKNYLESAKEKLSSKPVTLFS